MLMAKTTTKRTSFCTTNETYRQLLDLSEKFGENKSQVITRAIHMLHYSLRFPNVPLRQADDQLMTIPAKKIGFTSVEG
jgi:hypothetical protein